MIYSKLKNSIDIDTGLQIGLSQVEDQLSGSGLVVDLTVTDAPIDPRLNAHSSETENQADSGERAPIVQKRITICDSAQPRYSK